MPTQRQEIAKRFQECGIILCGSKRGWKKKFAGMLKVSPMQVSNLLKGRDSVGGRIQSRLREIGADVDYILTGQKKAGPQQYEIDISGYLSIENSNKWKNIKKVMIALEKKAEEDPENFGDIVDLIMRLLNYKSK